MDAYQFVSQASLAKVVQIVDPLYTVLVQVPKKRLPKNTSR
jgi:acetamidase/formamidase